MSGADKPAAPGRGTMHFRKADHLRPKLPAASAARQGDITRLAFTHLGGREGAIAFLNTADPELGGRPIDLAVASPEGFDRVKQEIARRAALG